jgi:EF-P beta-lysylation protein EpmB
MIPASTGQKNARPRETRPEWQRSLADAIRDAAELHAFVGLSEPPAAHAGFPVRVPRGYARRMRRGDPHDPLLAQVRPGASESIEVPGYGADPVGDGAAMMRPGVLHKYAGRVLLVTTGACAVHCRYCFRREFPYADANPKPDDWRAAIDYIAGDETIGEVILSGGDPLSLADAKLAQLVARIEAIPHVHTLRLHTRMPVVLPERVDAALCEWLAATRLATVVVLHANHGNEIDAEVGAACRCLAGCGSTLLNQAVLLHGVNDDADALAALSHRLFASGVLPYYLHLLDPVRGASSFAVDAQVARRLLAEVAARLPGYLVPRLVVEQAGRPGKTPIAHDWADLPPEQDVAASQAHGTTTSP